MYLHKIDGNKAVLANYARDLLIMEESSSFFVYVGEEKKEVYVRTSADGTSFLTTDRNGYNMDTLNFLPILDKPLFKRLIEPVR